MKSHIYKVNMNQYSTKKKMHGLVGHLGRVVMLHAAGLAVKGVLKGASELRVRILKLKFVTEEK